MLAFFNFSDQAQTFKTDEEFGGLFQYCDMITGEKFSSSSNEIKIEGYGFKWLLANL